MEMRGESLQPEFEHDKISKYEYTGHTGSPRKNGNCFAICEEEDKTVMDGVRIPVERSAALLKWKMVGEVLVPGVFKPGDMDKTDGCRQAEMLAEKFRA